MQHYLIIKEKPMETTLEKIYPDHTIVGLNEMIVEGSGWYSTLITDSDDIFAWGI